MPKSKANVKVLEKIKGLWQSNASKPVKSKKDLSKLHYKSIISAVQEVAKNQKSPQKESQTIGVVSVLPPQYYPLVEAKAVLINQITGLSTIPLLLECKKPSEIGHVLSPISPSFQSLFVVGIREDYLLELAKSEINVPFITDIQSEATCVAVAILNASVIIKKKPAELNVLFFGHNPVQFHTVHLLDQLGITGIVAADERGSYYAKRPNLNKQKIALMKELRQNKKMTIEECLQNADVILTTEDTIPRNEHYKLISKKAVVINLSETQPKEGKSSITVTGTPGEKSYISDVLISSILLLASIEGHKLSTDSYAKVATAIHKAFKPTKNKLLPHVLEKKLLQKIAKKIK
jgi:malic enzyme